MAKPKYNVPDGFKRCSRGDNCVHSMGCVQPADSEHFSPNRSCKDGFHHACRSCKAIADQVFNSSHPERRRAIRRRHYLNHAEFNRARSRAYNRAHRPARVEYNRAYRRSNPDKVKQFNLNQVVRRSADPRYPHFRRVYEQLRQARKRGLPELFFVSDWLRALGYFGGCCAICGRATSEGVILAADHWIPLADSRPDNPGTVPTNIVPLCHGVGGCNNRKGSRDPIEFLQTEFGTERAAEILYRIEAYFAWVKSQADQS